MKPQQRPFWLAPPREIWELMCSFVPWRPEPWHAWQVLCWWVAGGTVIGAAPLVIILATPWRLSGLGPLAGAAPAACIMMGWVFSRIGVSRLRRRVLAAECRLCTGCGYDLRGTAEPGPCPECGRFFSIEHLVWEWRAMRTLRRAPAEQMWRALRGRGG